MLDRESVITHLQIIHTWAEFAREHDLQFFTAKHLEDIVQWTDDALELLKEQESVKPIRLENWWKCPSCSGNIVANMNYCPGCGRKVKWND